MISINGKDGSVYAYNEATGLIVKDGVIQSSAEYEPLFFPGTTEFSGVYCKLTSKVVSLQGDIGDLRGNSEVD